MKKSLALQVAFFVLFAASCGPHHPSEMLEMIRPADVAQEAAAFQAAYPESVNWIWDSTSYLEAVRDFVCAIVTEVPTNPTEDWQSVRETLSRGDGNCADFAFVYCSLLRALGYSSDLTIIEGTNRTGQTRIWCEVWVYGQSTWGHIMDADKVWPIDSQLHSREVEGYLARYTHFVPAINGVHVP